MHLITRKLFFYHLVLLAGCTTRTATARSMFSGTVSLAYVARLYSMRAESVGSKITMKNKYNTLEIETNSRRAWINGVMVWLHHPCRKTKGQWAIQEVDFKIGIDAILRSYAQVPDRIPRLVMLDPGHGGKDSGAIGASKIQEKAVVLDISHRVKRLLESRKIPVRLTRSGDSYPSLQQRSAMAYQAGADLFVSIHADGAGSPSANGVETFILTASGSESSNHYGQGGDTSTRKGNRHDGPNAILGFSIQSNLVKTSGRSDRGLRRARFAVLKESPCPAALVECGFLTNPSEESLLNSSSYRDAVARGIANGILGYFTLIKRTR